MIQNGCWTFNGKVLVDRLGWPVVQIKGRPITNLIRLALHARKLRSREELDRSLKQEPSPDVTTPIATYVPRIQICEKCQSDVPMYECDIRRQWLPLSAQAAARIFNLCAPCRDALERWLAGGLAPMRRFDDSNPCYRCRADTPDVDLIVVRMDIPRSYSRPRTIELCDGCCGLLEAWLKVPAVVIEFVPIWTPKP